MKKLLCAVCAMLLMLGMMTMAGAESAEDRVFTLLSRDALGVDTVLGSAVLVEDGQTLVATTQAVQATGALYAKAGGVTYAVTRGAQLAGNAALLRLTIDAIVPISPMEINTADVSGTVIVGVNRAGKMMRSDTTALSGIVWQNTNCTLVSAEEGFLCGAAVLDEGGRLVGMVAAVYGEGVGRYVVLPAEEIATALGKAAEEPLLEDDAGQDGVTADTEETVWLTGVKLTAQGAIVTVDWSESRVNDLAEDSVFAVFYTDPASPYYSFLTADAGATSCKIPAVPGRTVNVWVQHAHGEAVTDVRLPQDFAALTLKDARPFNKYGFKDTEFYLGTLPAGLPETGTEVAQPLTEITAEELLTMEQDLYMQVTSRYRVTRQEECELLTVLYTPDGACYALAGGFLFDPSLSDGDVWHVNVTQAFQDYQTFNQGIASGTYTLCYYLDGTLGSTLTFDVK